MQLTWKWITFDSERESQIHLRLGVHLTLVNTSVTWLHEGDCQSPLVARLRMLYWESPVTSVRYYRRCQNMKISLSHPGYLQAQEKNIFSSLTSRQIAIVNYFFRILSVSGKLLNFFHLLFHAFWIHVFISKINCHPGSKIIIIK